MFAERALMVAMNDRNGRNDRNKAQKQRRRSSTTSIDRFSLGAIEAAAVATHHSLEQVPRSQRRLRASYSTAVGTTLSPRPAEQWKLDDAFLERKAKSDSAIGKRRKKGSRIKALKSLKGYDKDDEALKPRVMTEDTFEVNWDLFPSLVEGKPVTDEQILETTDSTRNLIDGLVELAPDRASSIRKLVLGSSTSSKRIAATATKRKTAEGEEEDTQDYNRGATAAVVVAVADDDDADVEAALSQFHAVRIEKQQELLENPWKHRNPAA